MRKEASKVRLAQGWGEAGEKTPASPGFSWLHVPPGVGVSVVVLSESPLRYQGHWGGHAVIPCRRTTFQEECVYCRHQVGLQNRFVLCVVAPLLQTVNLFECGESTARQIKAILDREAGKKLRGLSLHFRREGGRPRGAILAAEAKMEYGMAEMPPPVDIEAALLATWERQGRRQIALPFGAAKPDGGLMAARSGA